MNLPLQLDRSAPVPLQDQLFEQLRQLIVTGRLKPNTRLIATRFLAEQVGVSRRTVLFAYERLIAEGYLDTRPAIGTYVSPVLPDGSKPSAFSNGDSTVPRHAVLFPAPQPVDADDDWDDGFPAAQTAAQVLPAKIWSRLARDVIEAQPDIFVKPAPVAGVAALRRVIIDYLAATRGLAVHADQVFIVSGRRHAANLLAQVFQDRDAPVILETPGDEKIAAMFRTEADEVIAADVDEFGLDVDALPAGPANLLYVTPARQNPLGANMPPSRRAALIEWARCAGAYIIEDDCDGELRYQGVAHPPLAALDPYGLVFHVGSFDKVLGEGLRVGYLLVPPEFRTALAAAKEAHGESGQAFQQMMVANLLASGEYDHQLRRLRKIFLERRDALIGALKNHFGDVELMGTATGTEFAFILPDHLRPVEAVREAAAEAGLRARRLSGPHSRQSRFADCALVFDYASLTPESLRDGVAAMAGALKTWRS